MYNSLYFPFFELFYIPFPSIYTYICISNFL